MKSAAQRNSTLLSGPAAPVPRWEAARRRPDLRVGISGWTYAPWRGSFFPSGLVQKRELAYAASQVNSIEINGTFYSLQRPASYRAWRDETPDRFLFAVKAPRFITHIRRLKDCRIPLANFFASGVLALGEKLGPLLWQLPPSLPFDPDRLEAFLRLLPADTAGAAVLARAHDAHLRARAVLTAGRNRPLRHALEVRHASFACAPFVALLRRHGVALVVADTAGKWPLMEDVTADFVYVRLHGDAELYVSGYTPEALDAWAARIRAWSAGGAADSSRLHAPPARGRPKGRDVFVYFDNDVKTHAPYDAMALAHRLGLAAPPGEFPAAAPAREAPRTRWPSFPPRTAARRARPSPRRRPAEPDRPRA